MMFVIRRTRIRWNPLKTLMFIMVLFYLCLLFYVLLSLTAVQSQGGSEYYTEVTINQGETLWTVAQRYFPNRDPRTIVAQLRAINKLSDPTIYPGQILAIPR